MNKIYDYISTTDLSKINYGYVSKKGSFEVMDASKKEASDTVKNAMTKAADILKTKFNKPVLITSIDAVHYGYFNGNDAMYDIKYIARNARTLTTNFYKPIQTRHYAESEDVIGRVIKALPIVYTDSNSIAGKTPTGVITVIGLIADPYAIEKILDGRYNTVSVRASADYKDVTCSICGEHPYPGDCNHERGMTYKDATGKDVVCKHIVGKQTYKEISYVPIPADKYAKTTNTILVDQNYKKDSAILRPVYYANYYADAENKDSKQIFNIYGEEINLSDVLNYTEPDAIMYADSEDEAQVCLGDFCTAKKDTPLKDNIDEQNDKETKKEDKPMEIKDNENKEIKDDKTTNVETKDNEQSKDESKTDEKTDEVKDDEETKSEEVEVVDEEGKPTYETYAAVQFVDALINNKYINTTKEAKELLDSIDGLELDHDITDDYSIDKLSIDLRDKLNEYEDAKLSTTKRKKLQASSFCGPNRTFPVPDCAHVTAARRLLGRSKLSSAQKAKVYKCVNSKAKKLKCDSTSSKMENKDSTKIKKTEETMSKFQFESKDELLNSSTVTTYLDGKKAEYEEKLATLQTAYDKVVDMLKSDRIAQIVDAQIQLKMSAVKSYLDAEDSKKQEVLDSIKEELGKKSLETLDALRDMLLSEVKNVEVKTDPVSDQLDSATAKTDVEVTDSKNESEAKTDKPTEEGKGNIETVDSENTEKPKKTEKSFILSNLAK